MIDGWSGRRSELEREDERVIKRGPSSPPRPHGAPCCSLRLLSGRSCGEEITPQAWRPGGGGNKGGDEAVGSRPGHRPRFLESGKCGRLCPPPGRGGVLRAGPGTQDTPLGGRSSHPNPGRASKPKLGTRPASSWQGQAVIPTSGHAGTQLAGTSKGLGNGWRTICSRSPVTLTLLRVCKEAAIRQVPGEGQARAAPWHVTKRRVHGRGVSALRWPHSGDTGWEKLLNIRPGHLPPEHRHAGAGVRAGRGGR